MAWIAIRLACYVTVATVFNGQLADKLQSQSVMLLLSLA